MVEQAQEYLARRSKYEMIDMSIANQLVIESAKAKFPVGLSELEVGGECSVKLPS